MTTIINTQAEAEALIKDGIITVQGDLKINCSIRVDASIKVIDGRLDCGNITCWDITCWDITCRNINCGNITCWDITCWDITCWNISFYAF
ncbi:MAG: hypothetical protein M0R06_06850, partial [Sphaerochaeta sp.]|nr:hypothetical protein [Sphaerochaeta sp.]